MKWILGLATALAVVAAAIAGGSQHAQAQDATVSVGDNFYDPATVTISVGDTVTWNWTGSLPHTVTATDGAFDSPQQTSGSFSQTFATAGTFSYFCEVHGMAMSGTVTVAAAGEQPTAPAAASPTVPAAAPTSAPGVTTPTAATGAGTAVAAPSTGTGGSGGGGATVTTIVLGALAAGALLVTLGAVASRRRA